MKVVHDLVCEGKKDDGGGSGGGGGGGPHNAGPGKRVTPAPSPGRQPMVDPKPSRPPVRVESPRNPPKAAARAQSRDPPAQRDPNRTINPSHHKIYPGDRVRLKGTNREGEAMYIGTAKFAGDGTIVVGIRLDDKRSSSDCDGKYKGERFFRCKPGYGVYLPIDDVEVMEPEDSDDAAAGFQELTMKPFSLDAALDDLVAQTAAKDHLKGLRNLVEVQRKRESFGVHESRPLHFVWLGHSGTGMSTFAKHLSWLLADLGVTSQEKVLEVTRKDIIDDEKKVDAAVKAAKGGVLFVYDAHTLKDPERSDSAGVDCVNALSKHIDAQVRKCTGKEGQSAWPQSFVVVLAGPRAEMTAFLEFAAGLSRVCSCRTEFTDFSIDELVGILRRLVARRQFKLDAKLTDERLSDFIRKAQQSRRGIGDKAGKGPGNIKLVQAVLEDAVARQTNRVWEAGTVSLESLTMLTEADFVDAVQQQGQEEAIQRALRKLDGIVGLDAVKGFVRSLHATIKIQQERRAAGIDGSAEIGTLHMIFQGNPGTGKTTVARVVADLLRAMGLLSSGHMVESDRSSLVAGYSGQTAIKTKAAVESALGGVLFIDEAYALVQADKDSFGREALDTLIKLVEDYRSELVVILAGYTKEMGVLVSQNPGVASRFPTVIEFEDYSAKEMMQIADHMLIQDVLILDETARRALYRIFETLVNLPRHSNGRSVRNILEKAKRNQALRLATGANGAGGRREELCTLMEADFSGIDPRDYV